MKSIKNHAKAQLAAGELALGMGLRQARTVDIAQIAKAAEPGDLVITLGAGSVSQAAERILEKLKEVAHGKAT